MKRIIPFLFLLLATNLYAKVWRVNNNPGIAADFTTIQAAHDGADFGDTLLIEPSTIVYGSPSITKKLVLIGAGYFLSENYPSYPVTTSTSIGQYFNLSTGSSGTRIIGLSIQSINILAAVSDIIISRSNIGDVSFGYWNSISNVTLRQNYIYGGVVIDIANGANATNIILSNNLIRNIRTSSQWDNVEATFSNNVFTGTIDVRSKSVFFNNIAVNSGVFNFNGAFVANNIDAGGPTLARFGTENNNQGNVSATAAVLMVGAPGVSTDGQWKLRPTSIAIGAGLNGVDCGMYGGDTPYILSGLPPIPVITKFHGTITGDNTTPIQVTVSVESKN